MIANRNPPDRRDENSPDRGEGNPPDRTITKRYLVECDGCSFERPAEGREKATEIGSDHHRETGHDVVAVEVPSSIESQ